MRSFNRSFRGGAGLGGFMAGTPVIRTMLFANVGVFLFEMFFGSLRLGGVSVEYLIQRYLYLYPLESGNFYLWQPFTYMFLHGGFTHILFNMLALIIFGPALEMTWGSRKTLIYYTLCGLGGGAAHILISPLLSGGAAPLVGASGAIFGLLAAFGLMFPDQVLLLNFFIPMKAKYAVLFYILLEVMSIPSNDGVGHLAHLGGAVVGIIYLLVDGYKPSFARRSRSSSAGMGAWQQPRSSFGGSRRVNDDDETFDAEYEEIGSTRTKSVSSTTSTMGRVITQEDIDRILDKIAASGYQNLTAEEREILFEASKKMEGR